MWTVPQKCHFQNLGFKLMHLNHRNKILVILKAKSNFLDLFYLTSKLSTVTQSVFAIKWYHLLFIFFPSEKVNFRSLALVRFYYQLTYKTQANLTVRHWKMTLKRTELNSWAYFYAWHRNLKVEKVRNTRLQTR